MFGEDWDSWTVVGREVWGAQTYEKLHPFGEMEQDCPVLKSKQNILDWIVESVEESLKYSYKEIPKKEVF